MKRISWENSAELRNECGDLLDGVVTVVHGHLMELSECRHVPGRSSTRAFWVVDISTVDDFFGIESADQLKSATWVAAVCFEDKAEAMLWFTNNVHKRLLMRDLHDQDLITFLTTIVEEKP